MSNKGIESIESERWINDYIKALDREIDFYNRDLERIVVDSIEDSFDLFKLTDAQVCANLELLCGLLNERRMNWYLDESSDYLSGGHTYNEQVKVELKGVRKNIEKMIGEFETRLNAAYDQRNEMELYAIAQNRKSLLSSKVRANDRLEEALHMNAVHETEWKEYSIAVKEKYIGLTTIWISRIWNSLGEILRERIDSGDYKKEPSVSPDDSPSP
jgi:hypothetical protein